MSFSFCLQINCHYSTVFELQTGIFIWFQLVYYFNTMPGTEDRKNGKNMSFRVHGIHLGEVPVEGDYRTLWIVQLEMAWQILLDQNQGSVMACTWASLFKTSFSLSPFRVGRKSWVALLFNSTFYFWITLGLEKSCKDSIIFIHSSPSFSQYLTLQCYICQNQEISIGILLLSKLNIIQLHQLSHCCPFSLHIAKCGIFEMHLQIFWHSSCGKWGLCPFVLKLNRLW